MIAGNWTPGRGSTPVGGSITAELVPEVRPRAAHTPVRTFRIHWLLSVFLLPIVLLAPRRIGPHLAASSWRAAYAAHILGLLLAIGLLFGQMFALVRGPSTAGPLLGDLSVGEELRRAGAAVVVIFQGFAANAEQGGLNELIGWTIGVFVAHGFIWLAAVALLPFMAAGERRLALYLRTVKLLLWSSAVLLPVGLFVPRFIVLLERHDMAFSAMALLLLWGLWSLSVIFRLGGRYGGPAVGPRWEDHPIACEHCGYALANQPLDGRCPECATPVRKSLPDQRAAVALAACSPFRFSTAFWRTWFAAVFRRDFLNRIRVLSDERTARRFAVGMALWVGAISAIGGLLLVPYVGGELSLASSHKPDAVRAIEYYACGAAAFVVGAATVPAWMMLVGIFASRAGFADSLRCGIVICYAVAVAPLIAILTAATVLISVFALLEYNSRLSGIYIPQFGTIEKASIIGCILNAPAAIALLLSFWRARRLLRASRYANA